MSQLMQSLAAALKCSKSVNVRVNAAPSYEEETSSVLMNTAIKGKARLVEGSFVGDGLSVGIPETGLFTHFMDGMQRVYSPLTVDFVPLVYGYVSAVIRLRNQVRKMQTYSHLVSEAIYCPLEYTDVSWLDRTKVRIVDTGTEIKDGNDSLLAFSEFAKNKVSQYRAQLEAEITSVWLQEHKTTDHWLLVDGSLTGDYNNYRHPNILGLIKSHQTQYFDLPEQRKIINMPVGCRSQIFVPIGRNRPEVYSWYLRLRSNDGQDPFFGLVRVEAEASERTLKIADQLSRQLLAERSPLSLPDYRWDKLIYPIHDCEQYLKSKAPSWTVLRSTLSG